MKVNIDKADMPQEIEEWELSNGGIGIIDLHNRLVCYNKVGYPDGNNWDWVRKDCRE